MSPLISLPARGVITKDINSILHLCGLIPMVLPLDVLEKSLNQSVELLLKDNRILRGTLAGYDDYMNMVINDTEETKDEQVRRLGTVILRGNNVVSISRK